MVSTVKDDPYDYSEFAGVGHNQPPTSMEEVRKLAELQLATEKEIANLEKALEAAKDKLKDISERRIPEKMENLDISSHTYTDGMKVEVEEKVRGALPVENRPKGHAWIEEKGHGGLLKTEVIVAYPKKKLEEAKKLVEELREKNLPANLERSVHHQTLDAFIREQLEQGKTVPLDIFTVFRQKSASVTLPKKETI